MKLCMLMLSGAVLAAGPAWASGTVVSGSGLAHDCFIAAKFGNVREGLETCNQALEKQPLNRKDRAATHDNRGLLLGMKGLTEDAEADYREAIQSDPTLGDSYVNLGSVLIHKEQFAQAVEQINHGLELGTSFEWVAYYDRALAHDFLGHYREAYYDYKKVLELQPNYHPAEERLKDFKVTNTQG